MHKFKVYCADCGADYARKMVARPLRCSSCGSDFIAVKQLVEVPDADVIARVRKLYDDGLTRETLMLAFKLDRETFGEIVAGDHGFGRLQPHARPLAERVRLWIDEQRKKRVLP